MSETFTFDVDYTTTYTQIEGLPRPMLGFVQMNVARGLPTVVGTLSIDNLMLHLMLGSLRKTDFTRENGTPG